MADHRRDAGLEQFLAERGGHLLRTAMLLTGSKEAGEDLLQAALERLLRRWRTIDGDPEGTFAAPSTTWPPTAGAATAVHCARSS
jgi:DNA-directed RNA polymerase specialized sigma24 family protein